MGMYFNGNKLVIIKGPKTICFNLTNKVDNSLKHEIDQMIKPYQFSVEQRKKRD